MKISRSRPAVTLGRPMAAGLVVAVAALATACPPPPPADNPPEFAEEEAVTPVDGTVPTTLTVITAPAQCPLSLDCSESWTDSYVQSIFGDHDPDIVVMTEFFWNGAYDNMIEKVQEIRPNVYNFYRGPDDGLLTGWGGTVIASKFVMTDKQEHEYAAALVPDSLTAKGVIFARQNLGILAGATSPLFLDVVATHQQAKTLGDFVSVIRAQMREQRDFLGRPSVWGENGLSPGSTNTTLKVYSGDLNIAGDGPEWLGSGGHGGAPSAARQAFVWLRDNVLEPIGLRDGLARCDAGPEFAPACAARDFVEVDRGGVVKQMYLPAAQLSKTLNSEGRLSSERNVYMIPHEALSFDTVSDHDARLVTYGLYLSTTNYTPLDPVESLKTFCADNPLHPRCTLCGELTPPTDLDPWFFYIVPPRMATELATALGAGDLRGTEQPTCAAPSMVQFNPVLDTSYCCPIEPGLALPVPPEARDQQCAVFVDEESCEQTEICTWEITSAPDEGEAAVGVCVAEKETPPESYFRLRIDGVDFDFEVPTDTISATRRSMGSLVELRAHGIREEDGQTLLAWQSLWFIEELVSNGEERLSQIFMGRSPEGDGVPDELVDPFGGGLSFEPFGTIRFSEYGENGEFISGVIAGVGIPAGPPYDLAEVSGSFRFRRTW